MNSEHVAAISKDVKEGLSRAGIGRAYHDRSLREFGPVGEEMMDLLVGNHIRDRVRNGTGMVLHSKHRLARDYFLLTARAMFLSGIAVKVVNPVYLVELREDDLWEDLQQYMDADCLFLTPFWEPLPSPFDRRQVTRLERQLLDRLDNKKPLFLHWQQQDGWDFVPSEAEWYSGSFLSVIGNHVTDNFPALG
jgi:hypothetical protein